MLDNIEILQFRMYIDRQNINYIRNNYEGKNDYEKLMVYNKEFPTGKGLYFRERSRFHNHFYDGNDTNLKEKYSYKGQVNDKIKTNNELSEFIINSQNGDFIIQWDVLKTVDDKNAGTHLGKINSKPNFYKEANEQKIIVETESFNYASQKDEHKNLDMDPASKSNPYENKLKLKIKDNWQSKNKYKYDEKLREPEDYEVNKK